jgi:small subunit ribosomal protein S17
MADEKKGTSAGAEVPVENNESTSADAEALDEPAEVELAEAPAAEADTLAAAEVAAEAVDEPASEEPAEAPVADAADEPDATEEPEAPAGEAATEAEATGTSAEAEVPAKRKRKRLPRPQRRQRSKPARPASAERGPIVRLEKPEHERGRRQERQGTVVSDAMEKTIVVKVEVVKAHPKYKKVVRRSVKFHAHDEQSTAKVGDVVRIVETRPLSKTKHWRLAEVVEAAK